MKEKKNIGLGMRIAQKRREKGLTQKDLAGKLSCSVKHMSHIECGTAYPSLDLLVDVSDILGCTLD